MDKELFSLLLHLREPSPSVKGEALERLVCHLFNRIPGWRAKIPTHTNADDYGVDVIVTSLSGKKIVVQCKNYSQRVGREGVGQVLYGKEKMRADRAILVSLEGFTSKAREEIPGVDLWGKEELISLYEAAESEAARRKLKLDETPRASLPRVSLPKVSLPRLSSPRENLPREDLPREAPPFTPFLVAALIFALLVVLVSMRDQVSTTPPPRPVPAPPSMAESREAVIQVVTGYDLAYRQALATNVYAPLYQWAFADFLDRKVVPFVERRKRKGCVILTYLLKPLYILDISFDDINAEAQVSKAWRQVLRCKGQPDQEVLNREFRTTYLLRYDGDRLKVFHSDGN
jgi:hypothetical protein